MRNIKEYPVTLDEAVSEVERLKQTLLNDELACGDMTIEVLNWLLERAWMYEDLRS